MPRFQTIRTLLPGLACCVILWPPAAAIAKKRNTAPATVTVAVCDTVPALFADNSTEAFIRAGEMVAERDIAFFTGDLLETYKILKNDPRNLTRLFIRCDRNWGATAYALALQAASRVPMQVVLMNYDAAGRDWERTAIGMGMIYKGSLQPGYTFGIYVNRQQEVWRKMLEAPLRWRRTFLDR